MIFPRYCFVSSFWDLFISCVRLVLRKTTTITRAQCCPLLAWNMYHICAGMSWNTNSMCVNAEDLTLDWNALELIEKEGIYGDTENQTLTVQVVPDYCPKTARIGSSTQCDTREDKEIKKWIRLENLVKILYLNGLSTQKFFSLQYNLYVPPRAWKRHSD